MSTWGDDERLQAEGLPVPRATALSGPHWQACQRGELLVQRCSRCAYFVFPPEFACTACFSGDLQWTQSTGRGVIYSYTVIQRPQRPEFDVPTIAAIIELEEGWHMLSNIIDVAEDDVAIGLPVQVHFCSRGKDVVLPMFELIKS